MDKCDAGRRQLAYDLRNIKSKNVIFRMDEGVERENQIKCPIFRRLQRPAVVCNELRMLGTGKAPLASRGALIRQIYADKIFTCRHQVAGPAAKARCDFQYPPRRQEAMEPGIDGSKPLGLAAAPGLAPFFTGIVPVISAVPRDLIPVEIWHRHLRGSTIQPEMSLLLLAIRGNGRIQRSSAPEACSA